MIVGGYAVMKYTEPHFTKNLDVWVHNSRANAERLFDALAQFGAPLEHDGITAETFCQDEIMYQIGIAPVRIDLLTSISGVLFADGWRHRVQSIMFGVPVQFVSLDDLIVNKQASGRSGDLEHLKRIQKEMQKKR
jgi:predicted nucleotidyltransferase